MRVFKSVWQRYAPTPEVAWLLEQFRQMLNDCIRIGLAENVTSLKALSLKAYRQLSRYDVASYYELCAISAATGILRDYRKVKRKNPHVCSVNLASGRRCGPSTSHWQPCLQVPSESRKTFRPTKSIHESSLSGKCVLRESCMWSAISTRSQGRYHIRARKLLNLLMEMNCVRETFIHLSGLNVIA